MSENEPLPLQLPDMGEDPEFSSIEADNDPLTTLRLIAGSLASRAAFLRETAPNPLAPTHEHITWQVQTAGLAAEALAVQQIKEKLQEKGDLPDLTNTIE